MKGTLHFEILLGLLLDGHQISMTINYEKYLGNTREAYIY